MGHAPDMALVLTPPNARQDYAALLATARIPTLMEKPLERSHAGAQAVADLYAQAQVPLGLCFQHRTRASVRSLKHKLEIGALGAIVHVEMRVPWWRICSGAGVSTGCVCGTRLRPGKGLAVESTVAVAA